MSNRLLIIGGGAIADSTHIPAAKSLVGVDNVILAELNLTQREKLVDKHRLVHAVSDYHKALPECDVCIICTPPHVRNAILKDCIAAGKHVLCEKPLSPSSTETKAILTAAPDNLTIGMCHTYRFYPSRKEARELVQSGFFGDNPVVTINEGLPSNWPTVSGYCFKKELVPGGALYDNGIHSLDFLLWCFGKPKEIVYEDDALGGLESNLTINFKFDKAKAFYKLSRTRELSNTIVFEGNGHRGELDIFDPFRIRIDGEEKNCQGQVSNMGVAQLKNFLDAIEGEAELSCPVSDGLAVIETLERCYAQKKALRYEKHLLGGFKGKRVFVSGGTGFIGSHLVEQLCLHEGALVRVLVHNWGKAAYVSRFNVELVKADLNDLGAMEKAIEGCDYVIHLAIPGGKGADGFIANNVKAVENILAASKKNGVKHIVHLSSIVVHGDIIDPGLTADSPFKQSNDTYSQAKLHAENQFWKSLKELGLSGSVIRPTYVWGPYSMWYTIHIANQMKKGDFCWVDHGNGTCNAVYVGNVVDLCLKCCIDSRSNGQAFIATDGEGMNWRDFYCHYLDALGIKADTFPSIPQKDGTDRIILKKLKSVLQKKSNQLWGKVTATENAHPIKAKYLYRAPRKIVRLLLKHIVSHLPELPASQMAIYTQTSIIDTRKNKDVLGYTPRYSIEKGMKITCDWLRWSDLYD